MTSFVFFYPVLCKHEPCPRRFDVLWQMHTIDLKIDNLDRVSIPTKIVATFDVEHPILGTTNEYPKSVNSGKITSALHVFYLNLNLLVQNTANCSDTGIQLRMHALFRCHKWSQESGVRHQKWPRFL